MIYKERNSLNSFRLIKQRCITTLTSTLHALFQEIMGNLFECPIYIELDFSHSKYYLHLKGENEKASLKLKNDLFQNTVYAYSNISLVINI